MAHLLAPEVEGELDDIWYYVVSQSGNTDLADSLIDSITERFLLLSTRPQIGRRRDHDLIPGLRSFSVGRYVIIYRIEHEDVLILHVAHGSRDIEGMFRPVK
jgi:toxin ParE1/3/4